MNRVLHFGVGAFHRSHQAYTWHKLRELDQQAFGKWVITGVCLLPGDRKLVEALRAQSCRFSLKMCSPDGTDAFQPISSIGSVLYGPEETTAVIDCIASPDTRIVSFTITEGGYHVDFSDLADDEQPRTVFGYLAKGLEKRRQSGGEGLVMMSCDNIQENGKILKKALLSFLDQYNAELSGWAAHHLVFPNSVVDRITPVTTEADKQDFEKRYGIRDEALVISEPYFQWVLEDCGVKDFPPLEQVGVEIVADVHPYESMKLGLLNAGHSLVGFLGGALGYRTIHESVVDKRVSRLFDHYALKEAIPVLEPIEGVDYNLYFQSVKSRFSNAMINDSTDRIISGSSDKIPKFILPVVQAQLGRRTPSVKVSSLVIAAWWYYLEKQAAAGQMQLVQDNLREPLAQLFSQRGDTALAFIRYQPVFGDLASNTGFLETYLSAVSLLSKHPIEKALDNIMTELNDE